MNDWEYETELAKFKRDYVFVLEHAIRNDDSAKDKLSKIYALAYQMNNSCKRFIKEAMENKETRLISNFCNLTRGSLQLSLIYSFKTG